MVAKFVSVEEFAIRAGLGGDVDALAEEVQTKARYSLEAATTYLAMLVRTEFDAVTGQVDTYYVDSREFPWVGEFPRLYLSRGFVTTAVSSLDVRTSTLLDELAGAPSVGTDYLVLDQTKGTLLITGTDALPINALNPIAGDRYFVRLTYDAGFTETEDAYGSVYDDPPQWLKEAALLIGKQFFDTGQPCDDKGLNGSGCPCIVEHLVTPNIRFYPSALGPLS